MEWEEQSSEVNDWLKGFTQDVLSGTLKWCHATSRLINCTFEKSFVPGMPSSRRFMPAMEMQVADLVVDGRTTVGRQPLI